MTLRFTPDTRSDFRIEELIRREADKVYTDEYNCQLRRLLPWPGMAETKRPVTEFGAMIVCVRAGTEVDRHAHDEEEAFIVTRGQAHLFVEDQQTTLLAGDVAYIPRNWAHQLTNPFDEDFEFVDVYWDFRPGPAAAPASP